MEAFLRAPFAKHPRRHDYSTEPEGVGCVEFRGYSLRLSCVIDVHKTYKYKAKRCAILRVLAIAAT